MTEPTRYRDTNQPRIFDPEQLGRTFRDVGADVIEGPATAIVSRWFHSPQGADLFVWLDGEKRLVKHQLSFFGQVVEWNPLDGTRTGMIVEQEAVSPSEEPSETIRFDRQVQTPAVEHATVVLRHVPELDEDLRQRLIHALRESPKLHPRARERALKAWATKAEELSTDQRPTFWKRLKNWVKGD